MERAPDGNFIIAGHSYHFNNPNIDFYILKVTPAGNVLWNKAYGTTSKAEMPERVLVTSDNKYLIAGHKYNPTSFIDSSVIVKTDTSGNVLWVKSYNGVLHDACEMKQGGYAFSASSYITYWRTDINGNITGITSYGTGFSCYTRSIIAADDSGLVIAGSVQESFSSFATDAMIVKTDKNNNIQWIRSYQDTANTTGALKIITHPAGGYVVYGTAYDMDAPSPAPTDMFVLRIDAGGNLLWNKRYEKPDSQVPIDIVATSNGGYMLLGFDNQVISSFGYDSLFTMKLDASGNILTSRLYARGVTGWGGGIGTVSDGGYFLSASILDGNAGYIGIIKTDSAGKACDDYDFPITATSPALNVITRSHTLRVETTTSSVPPNVIYNSHTVSPLCQGISGIDETKQENGYNVFPNPFTDKLSFTFAGAAPVIFSLYNVMGQKVYSFRMTNDQEEHDLSFLKNGLYFYKAENSSGTIAAGKVVKE